MQSLGYPATWPTSCFISGGCGAGVFAHTNGYGDFVLLDELGPPWPVHECYANRFLLTGHGTLVVRHERLTEYRCTTVSGAPPASSATRRDIKKVNPVEFVGQKDFLAIGYVQDYVERRADALVRKSESLGQQVLERILGNCRSQLTLVTTELKSYTVFADLSRIVVQRKDMICARLQAVRVVGLAGIPAIFLADQVLTIRGDAPKRVS